MGIDESRTDDPVPAGYYSSLAARRAEILADFGDFVSLNEYIVVSQHHNIAVVMGQNSSVLQKYSRH